MQDRNRQEHASNMRKFGIGLFIVEVIYIFMFCFFVKVNPDLTRDHTDIYYPMFQDVNVMMIVGIGFIMTFIGNHSWSGLTYIFLGNCLVVQSFILMKAFWHHAIHIGWEEQPMILIEETTFSSGAYAVTAMLVGFAAIFGKVGSFQLLLLILIGMVGYSLNVQLLYHILDVYDTGGSIGVHAFGAYYGVTITLLLSRKVEPKKQFQTSYTSNITSMLGCLFLWAFWPSINAAVFPLNDYERSLVRQNTMLALIGSCLTAFGLSALFRKDHKFDMEDLLNSTLSGGVIIGAASQLFTNTGGALGTGVLGGIISVISYMKISPGLKLCIGLYDTCNAHNLHGIQAVLGGIISGIVIAFYQVVPIDPRLEGLLKFYQTNEGSRSLGEQAAMQIAGTFISVGIAIVFGIISGLVIRCFHRFQNQDFFHDKMEFRLPFTDTENDPLRFSLPNVSFIQTNYNPQMQEMRDKQ